MNQDLKTFCTLFYQAANIPVTCFTRKGQEIGRASCRERV